MQAYSTAAALKHHHQHQHQQQQQQQHQNNSPRKEIIAIKKLNYAASNQSPRGINHLTYTNSATIQTGSSQQQNSHGGKVSSSSSSSNNNKKQLSQQQMTSFHQTSIDLEYLTRKLKQFQLAPSPSSPTLNSAPQSSSRRSSSSKKQQQQQQQQHDKNLTSAIKKHHYHLHRSVSNADHERTNPYLIEYSNSRSEPNTDRSISTSKSKPATLMRTTVVVESEEPPHSPNKSKEKVNRSHSQMAAYRRDGGTTNVSGGGGGGGGGGARFEVSRVYASKLAYEKAEDFPCYSEAGRRHTHHHHHHHHHAGHRNSGGHIVNHRSSGVPPAATTLTSGPSVKQLPIKKSKSSHVIKSSYSPDGHDGHDGRHAEEQYSDSNRTTPSTSQSNFNNEVNIQPSSRSSKQSHVRSTSPTSTGGHTSSPSEVDDEDEDVVNDNEKNNNEEEEEIDESENESRSSSSPRARSHSRSATPDEAVTPRKGKSTTNRSSLNLATPSTTPRQPNSTAAPPINYLNKSGTVMNIHHQQQQQTVINPTIVANSQSNQRPIGELGVEAAAAARIKFRRASVNNLVNTFQSSIQQQQQQLQRSIVIRREKSASVQASNSKHEDDTSLRQHHQNSDTSASHNHRETYSSTTTSGIESYKNSLNLPTEQSQSTAPQQQQQQQQSQQQQQQGEPSSSSYVQKINELKNRLFVMEIELDNEKKKLSAEKDMKTRLMGELKTRYENEKTAALRALEAKLNAEKLYELNKLRETFEAEKRDEIDCTQKSFDSEVMSLKLKLRDKTEKCLQLEKLLKEEYHKNSKFYLKSMEVVRKYNNEMKMMNNDETGSGLKTTASSNAVNIKPAVSKLVSIETQTQPRMWSELVERSTNTDHNETEVNGTAASLLELNMIRAKLFNIKFILEETTTENNSTNIEILLAYITSQVRDLKLDSVAKNNEIKALRSQNTKIVTDFKQLKDAKLKLESLYKIKCKSDLNKSAQIKKLEISYQIELIKFRNEFNSDLVRYLETKLLRKESLVNENFNLLTGVLKTIDQLSGDKEDGDSSGAEQQSILLINLKGKLDSIKEPIKCLLNSNLFSPTEPYNSSGTNNGGSSCNNNSVHSHNSSTNTTVMMMNHNGNNNHQSEGGGGGGGVNFSSECKKIPLNLIVKSSSSNEQSSSKCLVPPRIEDKLEPNTMIVSGGSSTGESRPNKIPIQKFSSTEDFNRTKKLHDDMAKIDRKLKNMDKISIKQKPVILPGGCSFREDNKKPNLSSAIAAPAQLGKSINTSVSITAINDNLNTNNTNNNLNTTTTQASTRNPVTCIVDDKTVNRKMNVQIIQKPQQQSQQQQPQHLHIYHQHHNHHHHLQNNQHQQQQYQQGTSQFETITTIKTTNGHSSNSSNKQQQQQQIDTNLLSCR